MNEETSTKREPPPLFHKPSSASQNPHHNHLFSFVWHLVSQPITLQPDNRTTTLQKSNTDMCKTTRTTPSAAMFETKNRVPSSTTSSSSYLDMLLDSASSSSISRSSFSKNTSLTMTHYSKAAAPAEDCCMMDLNELPLEDDIDMTDVLMASINLEDSAGFLDFDEEDRDETEDSNNKDRTTIYDSLLFDPTRQQFEWREEASLLRRLRVTRLSTLWEE